MDITEINSELQKIVTLSPLEIDEKIEELVEKSGKKKGVLTKQFEKIKKEYLVAKEQEEKNFPTEELEKKIGNAFDKKALVQDILYTQPCYYDRAKSWWLWNWPETKWERVDETDILNAIERQATINTINSKEKNELLEALKQVSRQREPIPIKNTWIQFRNEIIDIDTGEKFRAKPDYFVTNPIPWALHEENFIETPNMDRIFEEWVGKENVAKLYEIIAYCLIPDYPINRLFCFIGGGMNGKSKYLDLLRKFVGGSNVCSTELDTLLTSRFEVTRLHKKLVCQMGETNFGEMSKTSLLKKLTGGDLIGFEYKNKDPFEEKNYAKIIIATNNLPVTTDKTIGFYRRWMIIDFPNQFSEKKDILADIPDEEYKALAVKCSFILRDLLEKRSFTNEGSIEERMEKYEEKANFLDKFLEEYTESGFECFITKADFFKKFSDWSKSNRHRSMSEIALGKEMKKKGYEGGMKHFNWMNDGKGGNARVWLDVKWK